MSVSASSETASPDIASLTGLTDSNDRFPIVVLISGNGSNLQSIIDSCSDSSPKIDIRAVLSNNPTAYGLERASKAGIATAVVNHRDYPDRESFEAALIAEIDRQQPALVVLAGFMRILTANFVNHYLGRLINIHPSLLPLYPGLNTHQRAIENSDSEAGATVHFVTPEVDGGPIIIQAHVPVQPGESSDNLASRVLVQEHIIYPKAIRWIAQGRLQIRDNLVLLDGVQSPEQQVHLNEI